eukprot:5147841-Pleurochrysis_carterae.AAC.1
MAAMGYAPATPTTTAADLEKKSRGRGKQPTAATAATQAQALAQAQARTQTAAKDAEKDKEKDKGGRGGKQPQGGAIADDAAAAVKQERPRAAQPTFAKGSIRSAIGRDGDTGAVEAFDFLVRQQHPGVDRTELPCAWLA